MSHSCCHSFNSVFILLGQRELCLRKDLGSKKAIVYIVKNYSCQINWIFFLKKFSRDTSLS